MRIYFDENFPRQLAAGFREFEHGDKGGNIDVIHVLDEFDKGTPDETWIPDIARKHGCMITQDRNIHRLPHQWRLCSAYKVGVFFFQPRKSPPFGYWDWVEKVFKHWQEIKQAASRQQAPFAFLAKPAKRTLESML